MAITYSQSDQAVAAASGTAIVLAFGLNVAIDNLLVTVSFWDGADTTVTVTDSQLNSYTEAVHYHDAGITVGLAIHFSTAGASAANTVTTTLGAARTSRGLFIHAYAGAATTNRLDKTDTRTNEVSNPATDAVVPDSNGQLIFAAAMNDQDETYNAAGSFTEREGAVTGTHHFQSEDFTQTPAASIAGSWTALIAIHVMVLATFRAPSIAVDSGPAFVGGRIIYKLAPQRWG